MSSINLNIQGLKVTQDDKIGFFYKNFKQNSKGKNVPTLIRNNENISASEQFIEEAFGTREFIINISGTYDNEKWINLNPQMRIEIDEGVNEIKDLRDRLKEIRKQLFTQLVKHKDFKLLDRISVNFIVSDPNYTSENTDFEANTHLEPIEINDEEIPF